MGAYYSQDLDSLEYNVSINNPDKKPNESYIYRNPNAVGKQLFVQDEKFKNMHDFYKRTLEQHAKSPFLGTRYSSEGQLQNQYRFETYEEIFQKAEQFGTGLSKYTRVQDKENNYEFVAIHSRNNYNYIIGDLACNLYGKIMLPLYDTLGAEANQHIYKETQVEVVLLESKKIKDYYEGRKNHDWYKSLKTLIILDNIYNKISDEDKKNAEQYFEILTFEQVLEMGQKEKTLLPWKDIKPDQTYTFSFTGGSTGFPKAVQISHGNMICCISTLDKRVITNGQRVCILSYLPMPHIFERVMFFYTIQNGGKVGMYSGDKTILFQDAQILKPTIFYSVPRIFNKIYGNVMKQIGETQGLKKKLFDSAYSTKVQNLHDSGCFAHGFYDSLAFRKLRNLLGGKVMLLISGGAPINPEVMDFFKVAFSSPFMEAYGQTEGLGGEFSTYGFEKHSGGVGSCFEHMEFKLVDVPEMNYTHKDKDADGNPTPRGELWIRGPNVTKGYYKNPEKTKELLEDGWMKSGDIVTLIGKNKTLKIIDRKKHIFKLSQGEYIAPEKLENIYKSANQLIANIFVYGNSNNDYVVAVINIEPGCLNKLAENLEIKIDENLQENEELKNKLLDQLEEYRKEKGLNYLEKIKKIIIDDIDWLEQDLVTPTFKNQRLKLLKRYKEKLEALYN